jgi:glycosyltransferase involved in cell wall biosynthesis
VRPRDPDALAEAMTQLVQMAPESLRQMGQNGRRHVTDRFSLDSVHRQYLNLYEQVLAASS